MALVALLSLSLVLFSISTKYTTLTQAQCLSDQRDALIQLKQGFSTTELHSWNASTDCCIWDGITCNEKTGLVTALNLTDRSISGKINTALFNLSSLQYLNFSYNNFYNIFLPQTGFERLGNLTHLDLSYSGFAGQVPITISAIKNLISLDLSKNELYLHDTGLKTLLRNLTKLQVIRLAWVDLSIDVSEWSKAMFQVGSTLQELLMVGCGLRGNFPDEIFHLTNLTTLHVTHNSFLSGQLPEFTRQSFLKELVLGYTNLTGPLPYSIENLQYLSTLALFDNNFYGEIPPSLRNLTRLEDLDLQSNRLMGRIPIFLFSLPSLEGLRLSKNLFSRYLPESSINRSSILKYIQLGYNNLQGQWPISLFNFYRIVVFEIGSNNFNGTFNLDIIKHNKKLEYLDLSNNKLSIIEGIKHNESFYASFPQLAELSLASSNFTKFPYFLSYQTNFSFLDLSNNSLTGDIPLSICNMTSLQFLDLSYNNLTGTVPPCLLEDTELKFLKLKSNKLNGPLPQNISKSCGLQAINLNGNLINGSLPKSLMYCNFLEILNLGNNQIVNRFPYWLGNLENLEVLVLGSNMFYGNISDEKMKTKGNKSFFPMLKVLDLSSNHYSGTLPTNILVNMKAMATDSDSSTWYSDYYSNLVTIIWKGEAMEIKETLNIFCSLDLSQNGFSGEIPAEIGHLKSLDGLNLSHNDLTSPIPLEFSKLQQLQSLDLSCNKLSGPVPLELTSLHFISALNLSYNDLVGEIPQVPQLSTFSNAYYLGNTGLCGCPLTMHCPTTPSNHGFNESLPSKSSTDVIGISVSIGLGISVGFVFIIWATISWESGRKLFNFIMDRFYFRHFQ